jgi:pimeloyl-ACP methyl ester carboxylesterase
MDVGMIYSERVISVGAEIPLGGVLTSPKQIKAKSPVLILLNSGLMHHVGTCNLSVKLARAIAKTGIRSYRFDSSGIGDSGTRNFEGSPDERLVDEVREVMGELSAQEGITQFVLCGLCSGADAALDVAAVDPRVVGIVQIDPMCFRTLQWYFYHYYPRILDINCWFRFAMRLFGKHAPSEHLPSDYVSPEYLDEWNALAGREPVRQSLISAYEELVSRGVHILVVMTTGQEDCYNSRGQFREAFGKINFGSLLEEHYLPQAQHIITGPEDQKFVLDLVGHWSGWVQSN